MKAKKVVAEISIVPLGTGKPGLSEYVAECLGVLKDCKSIKYRLTPMGTILEGNLEAVLSVARQMHEVPFDRGALRVVTTIKIDDRRDKRLSMEGKLASVRRRLPSVKM